MGASDVSQPRAGGPRAAPCQLLRSRPLPVRGRERRHWRSARGRDGRARAARAARDARASSRGLAVHASARAGRGFERGRACQKSFGES